MQLFDYSYLVFRSYTTTISNMAFIMASRYFTMIAPIILLPSALPTTLNHHKLAAFFLPIIIGIHGYNLYYLSDFGGIPCSSSRPYIPYGPLNSSSGEAREEISI